MTDSISYAALLDLLNDGPVVATGQEFAAHNLQTKDSCTRDGSQTGFLQAFLKDHVTQQPGSIWAGLPWHWMLKTLKKH